MNQFSDNLLSYKKRVWLLAIILSLLLSILAGWWMIMRLEQLQETATGILRTKNFDLLADRLNHNNAEDYLSQLDKSIKETNKKLKGLLPAQPYILINTTLNQFRLFDKDGVLLRQGLVSTGSYTLLRGNNRTWMFKTPRGQLKVLGKTKDPVWVRPDWAFIEEGLKVPPAGHPSRYEYGTLGDYSLSLGDGYLIHGTLYKRFLGLPVTHGCVRMGDEDLEATFKTLQVGSKVYIY